ncbi:MAG: efflux RND transporter periplasmic adaptor subunit [Rhodobacteraceae bacterium]|nr:efflux RND transporter periplasmic adaptor subunit [Paracoccaceae bacterium]
MRLIPALTALLVTAVLYLAVFERDRLIEFARGTSAGDTAVAAQPDAVAADAGGDTAETTMPAADSMAASDAGNVADTLEDAVAVEEKLVRVVVRRSVAQEIDNAVVLRGQTQADRQVEVRSETTARVVSAPLRKGSFVETGDVLCRLDPGTREATLNEAQARLREARARVPEAEARLQEAHARVEEARINDNAARKLSQGGFASETRVAASQAAMRAAEASVESARTGLETAQSGIQSAQAAVAAAEAEIDRLTIRAPFAGLLESDTAELGSLMQPGALCATVIQLNPIKIVGYVPETEVHRVSTGAIAGAQLANGAQARGEVIFLSRSADPQTRTFLVEIEAPNPDLAIRDGQTAEILISARGAQAHFLPQSALTLNNDGQLGVRIVEQGDRVAFNPVSLLRDTVQGVWVAGLPDTADVIVTGQDFVTEGVRVAATYTEATQ